jgi:multidrug resistance efflux pump
LRQAQNDLARAKNESLSQARGAEIELQALETTFEFKRRALERLEEQLQACKAVAPHAGMVLYAPPRSEASRLEVGSVVRRGQPILELHDLSRLQVSVNTVGRRVRDIQVGQRATLTLDARPGEPSAQHLRSLHESAFPLGVAGDFRFLLSLHERPCPDRTCTG